MTRRRHFPSILQCMNGHQKDAWAEVISQAKRLHADAVLLPMPWAEEASMAQVLALPIVEVSSLRENINKARKQRLGVFLEIALPPASQGFHSRQVLSQFQALHIKPLMGLDLAGMVIRLGADWPADAILELERLLRLKEGAVLFLDHGMGPDSELLDGQVDGVVDPVGVGGISRFLNGHCSGFDLGQHLSRQQERLGINLAGRLLNPLSLLSVRDEFLGLGSGLSFMIRGYPFMPPDAVIEREHIYGPLAQLRRQRAALEWGRFVHLSPIDRPEVFAFGRADERVEEPVIVVARRSASAAMSLPVGLGRFDLRKPFVSLLSADKEYAVQDGWLDLEASEGPEFLVLGQ